MRHQGIEAKSGSLRPVVMLVLGVLALRVVYLMFVCGYDLVEDEAQYWLWAQHPDWSYYSKGPGVAWAIWLSTKVLGNAEWAVRLPTALMSAIGSLAAGGLARDCAAWAWGARGAATEGRRAEWATPARVGLAAALAYTLVPALQAAGIVMTIDGPYIACWSVACWAAWRAMMGMKHGGPRRTTEGARCGGSWWWVLVGAMVGIGFLFKYTMVLVVPGLVLFALLRRRGGSRIAGDVHTSPERSEGGGRVLPLVIGIALGLTGIVPVIVWNVKWDWPTWKHLLGHLGVEGGDMPANAAETKWSPWWLPALVGQQLAIVGPWLVVALWGFWKVSRLGEPGYAGRVFMLCAAAPVLVFYCVVALIAEPEGNWPMAAYATLMPLAGWMGADAIAARRAARARGERGEAAIRRRAWLWRAGLWYAAVAAVPIHFLDRIGDGMLALDRQAWFHDAYHKMLGRDPSDPAVKMRDPAGRVRGAREMAGHVAELMQHVLNKERRHPFVITQHYGRASQLAYYLRAEVRARDAWMEPIVPGLAARGEPYVPTIMCGMSQMGGRRSQFDLWEHTRLDQPMLIGRPAVMVTSVRPETIQTWERMFERVEHIPGEKLRGESKQDRSALLGYGYKGLGGAGGTP